MSLAVLITKTINDLKYSDVIKHIYRLYLKDLSNIKQLCGKGYFSHTKKMMSIKRTNEQVYFKQQINILIIKVMKDINYFKRYNTLTPQSQFNINSFLSYYLTMALRNSLCS